MKSNDKIIDYNEETNELSITWNGKTVTHTIKDWIFSDIGNNILKKDLDRHFNK